MATRVDFNFGDDGSQESVVISSDQLARVVRAALQDKVLLSEQAAPHDLWRDIEAVTRLVGGLEDWRERAIVAVDESGTVDRYALGIAASMGAAKLYDLLERHGRPRNQTRLTQVEVLENRVTSENGEWDAVRVVATMNSYGWEIDDKRARALLRALTEQEVLEKIPNRGGRAVYQIVGPRDWLYCLDPERDTIENGPSTPARVARLARDDAGPTEWWLGKSLKRMVERPVVDLLRRGRRKDRSDGACEVVTATGAYRFAKAVRVRRRTGPEGDYGSVQVAGTA